MYIQKFDFYENNSEFDSCFVTKPYVSQMILCQWFYYCNWIFKQSTYKLPERTDSSSKTWRYIWFYLSYIVCRYFI